MAILDNIIDSVGKAGKFVVDKAVDTKDYVALEYKLSTLKSEIDKCYLDLGKYIYENKGENVMYDEFLQKINVLMSKKDELLKEMAKFKKTCPNCQKRAGANDVFCKNCGNKL